MSSLLVIDDAAIKRFLANDTIVAEFPFMRGMAAKQASKKKPCKCGGNKNRANVAEYAGIKSAIAGMPAEKKARLKQLVGAEQIRMYYTNNKRQKVKLTF
jgi:hypothetical protein